MVDIHCHILPGFDDGAKDASEALAMAAMAAGCGITDIVATPHFRGEPESLRRVEALLDGVRQLEKAIEDTGIHLTVHPGAEILCLPQTLELARRKALPTLGHTRYLLCEFYFDEDPDFMDHTLSGLAGCGYVPVVAHPERYQAVCRDPRCVERWFSRGYPIQLNKGSILGAFGYREQTTAHWILSRGLAHMVASDAHGADRRTPDMGKLRQRLLEKYPAAYGEVLLEGNPARLIRDQEMLRP